MNTAGIPPGCNRDSVRFSVVRLWRPPAKGCQPFGLNYKCATLKLTLRVTAVARLEPERVARRTLSGNRCSQDDALLVLRAGARLDAGLHLHCG